MRNILLLIISFTLLLSCYPQGNKAPTTIYPPANIKAKNELIIDRDYDTTWRALIDYSSSTFFAIKSFEKESGLITLSFGATNVGTYIDCGNTDAPSINYSGSVLGIFYKYGNPELDGSMNIFVQSLSPNRTKIRVNARYIFTYTEPGSRMIWSFDTGGSDSKQIGSNIVTCTSTNVAEENILDGVNQKFNNEPDKGVAP